MKKFSLILVSLFILALTTTTGYCFFDKFFKKEELKDPYESGRIAYDASNYVAAINEWKPLAEEGNISVQYLLANAYEKMANYQEALYWYTKAAENGHVSAQIELGYQYKEREFHSYTWLSETKQNNRTAAYWYTQAAQQGDSFAQYYLGELYKRGHGVLEDLEKARQLCTQAAYQGFDLAQKELGNMYYNGEGGPKDAVQAYAWWSLYISQNPNKKDHPVEFLDLITKGLYIGKETSGVNSTNTKDYKKMTPEEIDEAKKLTKQLYNKIYGELQP